MIRIDPIYMHRRCRATILNVFNLEDHIKNCSFKNTPCHMELYNEHIHPCPPMTAYFYFVLFGVH